MAARSPSSRGEWGRDHHTDPVSGAVGRASPVPAVSGGLVVCGGLIDRAMSPDASGRGPGWPRWRSTRRPTRGSRETRSPSRTATRVSPSGRPAPSRRTGRYPRRCSPPGAPRDTTKPRVNGSYPGRALGPARRPSLVWSHIPPVRKSILLRYNSAARSGIRGNRRCGRSRGRSLLSTIRSSSSETGSSSGSAQSTPAGHTSVPSAISLRAVATALSSTVDSNTSNRSRTSSDRVAARCCSSMSPSR